MEELEAGDYLALDINDSAKIVEVSLAAYVRGQRVSVAVAPHEINPGY